jgi:hypothetical protein
MAFVALPNGIKVTFVFLLYEKVVTITVHVTNSQGVDGTSLNAALTSAQAWWTNHLKPVVSSHLGILQIEALDVSREGGAKATYVYNPIQFGDVVVESMSANVANVFSLRTARTGRSYRGRIYIPGIPENSIQGNHLTAGAVTAMTSAAAGLITRFSTGVQTLVVASYHNQGAPRAVGVATPVTQTIVDARVDTQRRRLPR